MDDNRKEFFRDLAGRVHDLVVTNKLYLDHRLSLDDVADKLEVSRYYVSHAVNKYLGKTFHTLVNELRIEEAIRLMKEPGVKKIQDLYRTVGFADRSNFTRVCKRTTGLSPSELKDKMNNK